MQTQGIWCAEIAELDAMSRGEVSKIKAFISRTTDRFRPPYGSRIIESDRACVFWGSTNAEDYLKDETGGRRFWPIKVGKINIDRLAADRDQLWAEAQILYGANVPWWLTKDRLQEQAADHQRARYIGDPWEPSIDRYVRDQLGDITVEKVLRDGLGLDLSRWTQIEMNRVARCLRSLGFRRHQRRVSGSDKRVWVYVKVVPAGDNEGPDESVTTFEVVTGDLVVTLETPAE